MASPPHGAAGLLQIAVAPDGRVKALFQDNTILLVDASATYFTCRDPATGSSTRQLCAYALSRYQPRLALVLQFRNRHTDAPVWCKALAQRSDQPFALGFRISTVSWQLAAAAPSGEEPGAAGAPLVAKSADGTARITLDRQCGRWGGAMLPGPPACGATPSSL
jgi:hypothetical protein